jgi:hypothetical protein
MTAVAEFRRAIMDYLIARGAEVSPELDVPVGTLNFHLTDDRYYIAYVEFSDRLRAHWYGHRSMSNIEYFDYADPELLPKLAALFRLPIDPTPAGATTPYQGR